MPKQNPERTIDVERALAARIGAERAARGWSYEVLAQRMADAGCPIHPSAIFKIEKGAPRRRITLDEAVAVARVLDLDLAGAIDSTAPPRSLLDLATQVEGAAALLVNAARQAVAS